jgi:hypothetical protein
MKKLYFLLFAFSFITLIAQPKLSLKGTVYFENFPLQKIEIINVNTEKIVLSDANGHFEMEIGIGNKLVIGNSAYNYQTMIIKKEDIENKEFKVFLTKKIEELDEVEITNIQMPKIKFDQASVDARKLEKENVFPNNINNQNQIPNGADFMALGRGIGKLFKAIFNIQPKTPKEILPVIDIKSYVAMNFKPNYLTEILHLKPEQVNFFIEFCKSDANFEFTFRSDNVLLVMDFLNNKSTAFKQISK